MSKAYWLLALILVVVITACTSNDPTISEDEIDIDTATTQTFNFETGTGGFAIGQFDESSIELLNGGYHISSFSDTGNHYLIGQNSDIVLKNVVVEVTVNPIAGAENNWFGVVCRVDADETGYALLISSDGFWSIAKVRQTGSRQFLDYLRDWREDDNIRRKDANTITAYCVDDYLALYVNGEFLGDYKDDDLNRVGGVGLLAGGESGDRVTLAFDDVQVSSANRRGRANTPIPTTDSQPETTQEPVEIETLAPIDVPTLASVETSTTEPTEAPALDSTETP